MAARQIAEPQTTDPDSDEPFYFVTDFVKHPANLAIDSLAQDHAQPRRLDGLDLFQPGALAVEHDAAK